jgi:membrane protease subunit HflK
MLTKLQSCLDDLDTGIELVSVSFKDIHPPISVAGAFEEVIAGYQEKQKIINNALGYQYKTIPAARGKAATETQIAEGYIVNRLKTAEGESSRFIMAMPVSEVEKDVSITRLRLETVKEALKNKKTIVIDPKTGTSDIWMDFKGFFQKDVVADKEGG